MRGYLKSPGHQYYLDSEVTSIGRGSGIDSNIPERMSKAGAHIPLDSGRVERYHAVLEKNKEENCYILTDLNSAYGTYVNEHRIQNGAVKLATGDVIRFGHGGIPHEFEISQNDFPSDDRLKNYREAQSANKSKNTVESGYFKPRGTSAQDRGVSVINNITFRPDTAPSSPKNTPFLQLVLSERSKSVPQNLKITSSPPPLSPAEPNLSPPEYNEVVDGNEGLVSNEVWGANNEVEKSEREVNGIQHEEDGSEEPWYVAMLREKEQRLLHMGDEICRLGVAEAESRRKDGVISELRHKVIENEQQILELKNNATVAEKDKKLLHMGDEINRLAVFERECDRKDRLVATLRDQIAKLEINRQAMVMDFQANSTNVSSMINDISQNESISSDYDQSNMENESVTKSTERFQGRLNSIDGSLINSRDKLDEFRKHLDLPIPDRRPSEEIVMELNDKLEQKEKDIETLTSELSATQKELSLSKGLIKTLQHDASQREFKRKKLAATLEKSQREYHEVLDKARSMSKKFANLKEEKKHAQVAASIEKQLIETQEKLDALQMLTAIQKEKLDKQSKELRRSGRQNKQYLESGNLVKEELQQVTSELNTLKRTEQSIRVQNEQAQSRLERLRTKIIQAVYMAPGAARPENTLADAEVVNSIQKIIEDRSEFHQHLTDLGQQMAPLIVQVDMPADEVAATPESTASEKKGGKSGRRSAKK